MSAFGWDPEGGKKKATERERAGDKEAALSPSVSLRVPRKAWRLREEQALQEWLSSLLRQRGAGSSHRPSPAASTRPARPCKADAAEGCSQTRATCTQSWSPPVQKSPCKQLQRATALSVASPGSALGKASKLPPACYLPTTARSRSAPSELQKSH